MTYNFWIKGGFSGGEDYRWEQVGNSSRGSCIISDSRQMSHREYLVLISVSVCLCVRCRPVRLSACIRCGRGSRLAGDSSCKRTNASVKTRCFQQPTQSINPCFCCSCCCCRCCCRCCMMTAPITIVRFNLVFICLFQQTTLLAFVSSAAIALQSDAPWNHIDTIAACLYVLLLLGEATADRQMYAFQTGAMHDARGGRGWRDGMILSMRLATAAVPSELNIRIHVGR